MMTRYKIGQTAICAKFDEHKQVGAIYEVTIERVYYDFKGSYIAYEVTYDGYEAIVHEEYLFSTEELAFNYLQTRRKESLYGG